MATLTVSLPEEVRDEVRLLARVLGVSVSELARRSFSAFVEHQRADAAVFSALSAISPESRPSAPVVVNRPEREEVLDEPSPPDLDRSSFVLFDGFSWVDVRDPAALEAARATWASQDRSALPDPIPGTVTMAPGETSGSGFCFDGRELGLEELWAHVDSLGTSGLVEDPFGI